MLVWVAVVKVTGMISVISICFIISFYIVMDLYKFQDNIIITVNVDPKS